MMGPLDTRPIRAFLDPKHLDFASRVSTFAAKEIAPLPPPTDDAMARTQAKEILGLLGSGGWLHPIGEQDWRSCCLVREALGAASPLADAVFALQALGSLPIMMGSTGDLAARWLTAALKGRAMGGFAMTEPDAGSDVGAMATSARRDGADYVLDGTKTLISNAGIADYYCVFAVTDPSQGTKGITCFVVPADARGCRFVRPLILSSPHPLGEVAFGSCKVPAGQRLGAEGEGYRIGLATLDRLRPTVGAAACGMAARALSEALDHATTRKQFGKPLSDFQLVQEKLSRMATDLTAARLLVYRAAWEKDLGAERITLEAGMAKAFATEAAQRIIDDAVQILGGQGVLADNPVDRLYRSVRALRIYEGTTEIQHLVISGQLLKQHRGES
ncbi:MAG TPA: acyl-CoA dehydrogenase family protein [Gemmatimonadales bacterium]|nr:acyl-CoA dehydrogenase family protein [Gemmatimonadales bacterium]